MQLLCMCMTVTVWGMHKLQSNSMTRQQGKTLSHIGHHSTTKFNSRIVTFSPILPNYTQIIALGVVIFLTVHADYNNIVTMIELLSPEKGITRTQPLLFCQLKGLQPSLVLNLCSKFNHSILLISRVLTHPTPPPTNTSVAIITITNDEIKLTSEQLNYSLGSVTVYTNTISTSSIHIHTIIMQSLCDSVKIIFFPWTKTPHL